MQYQAHLTGFPVMCAMEFMFPDDNRFADVWDQYMFGSEMLCSPVVIEGDRTKRTLVPRGEWVDYNTLTNRYAGPSEATLSAPLDRMPLLIPAGAIIPRGDIYKGNNNWTPNWKPQLQIECFPAKSGSRSFPYYTGSGVVNITCGMNNGTVTITSQDLQVGATGSDGELRVFCAGYNGTVTGGSSSARRIDTLGATMIGIPFDGPINVTVTGVTSLFTVTGAGLRGHGLSAKPSVNIGAKRIDIRFADPSARSSVFLTDARGGVVRVVKQSAKDAVSIDLEDLPRGMYVLHIVNGSQSRQSWKVVRQ
jgi:hypothetical protein